jgi:hypothetical protein
MKAKSAKELDLFQTLFKGTQRPDDINVTLKGGFPMVE